MKIVASESMSSNDTINKLEVFIVGGFFEKRRNKEDFLIDGDYN